MRTVVLGYGNRSRNDDGVGWFVVEQLQRLALPDVELITSHQLDVDQAETISHFDTTIFVDAAMSQGQPLVTQTEVQAHFQSHAVAHYLTPADLLALSKTLYGREPRAILFSIRGHDFNFGTTLSPATEQGAQDVVGRLQRLVPTLQQHETNKGLAAHA